MGLKEKFYNVFRDQIVGGSVVLIKEGKEFQYQYGYCSLVDKKLVDQETIFRIASISKAIIGIAAMKLVENGQLDLDEDIGNYLGYQIRNPNYPNVPITTRMLMLHTSSITDGKAEDGRGYNGVNGYHYFVSLEDLLANQNSKVYSKYTYSTDLPGEKYNYSNFGAGIIACIIEKCSNQLFTEFVEQQIFKPLQMDASYKANKIIKKDKISDAFIEFTTNKTAKEFIDGTYPDFPLGNNFRGPAGGLFVSMADLSKVMIALMNDGKYKNVQIFNKETVDTLLNMNFFASRYNKEKQVDLKGYSGGAYGICSVMYFCKRKKTGVCFIANGGYYQSTPTGLNHIQEGVISLFVGEL